MLKFVHKGSTLDELALADGRYHPEAFRFLLRALSRAQDRERTRRNLSPGDPCHVTGQQLLEAVRQQGWEEFGYLTRTVFLQWGLRSSLDFGRIVFLLVENGLLRKTDEDSLEDFRHGMDFDRDLEAPYTIPPEEPVPEREGENH